MKANAGTKLYHPEMGDKTPIAEIFSTFSAHMNKFRVKTPLDLKGRGIKYYDTYTENNCNNSSMFGWKIYYVTGLAYQKLAQQFAIAQEVLLD